jgi:methionyl-tRNA formyltransferase
VKAAALELGLPVAHRVEDVLDAGADLGVVVAYGRLIRRPVLERLGFVNLHFSLLPRWRGAAPVERALLAGDAETGVCLMQLEEGLDTGPVFAHRRVPIDSRVTADGLRRQLVEVGSELLCTTLDTGLHDPTPQLGEATYAAKLTPADLEIDWGATADAIDRVVRVGGAWTTWRGRRLKVLDAEPADAADTDETGGPAPGALIGDEVATGSGRLRLLTVQPEGKPAMAAAAWRHGAHSGPADRLGT